MKRKIIKQGHNTLTITLPSKWVKQFNLSPGHEIDLIEKDNGLFLTTEKISGETKKTEIDITGMDIPIIWKYFMCIYREGYNEILVKFQPNEKFNSPYKFFVPNKLNPKKVTKIKDKSALQFLHSLINRFIGFEIIDYGKDFVIVKDMTELTSKEFDNSMRRVFLLVQQMSEETCKAMETQNPIMLSHIPDIDINLDKFHDYCIRILNKVGNKDSRKSSLLFSTLYLLELIGDEFKNISHHYLYDFPKAELSDVTDIANSIKRQFDLYYKLFYNFESEKIKEISEIDKGRYFSLGKTNNKIKKDEEKEIFHHLRIITRYINALTELRIEMEF